MSKEDMIELEGTVVEAMPNAKFKVEIQGGHQILAHISGKLRTVEGQEEVADTTKLTLAALEL